MFCLIAEVLRPVFLSWGGGLGVLSYCRGTQASFLVLGRRAGCFVLLRRYSGQFSCLGAEGWVFCLIAEVLRPVFLSWGGGLGVLSYCGGTQASFLVLGWRAGCFVLRLSLSFFLHCYRGGDRRRLGVGLFY